MSPPSPQPTASAVLVFTADGRVQLADAAARAFWQVSGDELLNERAPNLFTFDMTSDEPDWLDTQWEILVASAVDQPLDIKLQPRGASAFEVRLRLEKCGSNPVSYLAHVELPGAQTRPAAAPAVAPVIAAPASPANNFIGQLTERSPLGFFDLNFLKNEVHYSTTWKQMLGYTDATLPDTYQSWTTLLHPDDSAAAPDQQGNASGTRPFSLEYRMKHADGHYVWLHSAGVQIYGPNGALQRVTGAHLNVTERKEFEEAGLRAEERLQQLGGRGRVGMFDLDFANHNFWFSPGLRTLLGYEENELPNSLESFLLTLPIEDTTGGLQSYFLSQQPNHLSYFDTLRMRRRDNHETLVYAVIVRQLSRKKELQRVLGFVLPMPEGNEAPAQTGGLAPESLAALLGELREAILVANADGQIIELNAKAEKLLGRTTAQCLGSQAGDTFRLIHRLSKQPGESPIAKALTTGEATPLNAEFFLENGTTTPLPIAFSARPVVDPAGSPIGAVVVFRNPDEMTLTPEELIRANRFEALGQLAGGIAHDYNNLLTTILGGVSMAKDARDFSSLENSERACMAAKGLSKQLLNFAKGGTAVRQVVKPSEILADAVRLAAAGASTKIEVGVAADTSTICVDRGQMLQVFQNLIINAIQAMPAAHKGHIWINAGNIKLEDGQVAPLAAGTYVAFEVRDNGSGIKPEHLNKIFDPFFTTKKTGTGLGLATVLSIVKRHGGQMGLDSEVGNGTTFTVFLPQADKPIEVEARRPATLRFGTGRVLFMDDDEQISQLTGGMLTSLGYKFDLAKNGEEAVQLYKRYLNIGRPYDVVIMDLTVIGGMGGEQTFKVLRELDPDVRAIVASGYDNDDMARQFLNMGFLGYLTKPYRVADLGRILRTVLGK
ncbi:PAS domain-containing hybrid sensor histidine kinase/response regulator [Oleiharenicola lentus]|uniref:PAS domain-containing hybrid sensor histidine kinase/response regulator n=1 Tax=Oleiharenicola lentus TaxID=2508720 RepID=UPI003F681936